LNTLQSEVVLSSWIVANSYHVGLDLLLEDEPLGYIDERWSGANKTGGAIVRV
jgi:hypothetical protein